MTVVKIKSKRHKKVCYKKSLKIKGYKNCLEATQLENKVNHPEKNETGIESLKKDHKEFMKNNN